MSLAMHIVSGNISSYISIGEVFSDLSVLIGYLISFASGRCDGNCGFRAIAKQLTGTESNHSAIRAAIVQYMYDSNVNRTTHSIITSATVLTLTVIFIQPK